MSRSDPIRDNYFRAVEQAEVAANWLFYIGAALSLATLLVDRASQPNLYDGILAAFCFDVVVLFAVCTATRLYLTPRAEDKRRQDFFSSACGVNLTHEQTDGYYNNDERAPIRRIAAQVLENSHFSKKIALKMAQDERLKVGVYMALWFVCLLNRRSDLSVILAASQAVFSEQILSKWIRLEWLRSRFETTYDSTFRLFQSKPKASEFNAMALETLSSYETAKANAAITLSSRHFERMNQNLSAEWEAIKESLKI